MARATDQELEQLAADATPSGGDDTASPAQLLGYRPTDVQTAQAAQAADDAALANQPLPTPPVTGPAAQGAPAGPGAALVGVDPMAPAPITPASAPAPAPAADTFQAPPLPGKPTIQTAARALDQATQAGFDVAKAQNDAGKAKADESGANADEVDRLANDADRRKNEIQEFRETRQRAIDAANARAEAAEQEFRDFKYHDYWDNKTTGDKIRARIFLMLGGAQAGHQGRPDDSLAYLNGLIQQDYEKQRQKLGDIERFAKMKREGATSLTAQYQQDLGILQLKQAAATDQVANEVRAQMIRNGIPADQAQNGVVGKGLEAKALQDRAAGREKLNAAQQAGALGWARLADARVQAANKIEQADEKQINKRMDAYEKEAVGSGKSPGPLTSLDKVNTVRESFRDAVKSGDAERIKAEAVKVSEMAGTLMSGGKTTNYQGKLLEQLKSASDELVEKGSRLLGDPTEGKSYLSRLGNLLDTSADEYAKQTSSNRDRAMREHLDEGGSADTPEKKRVFTNRVKGLFGSAKHNGKTLFAEGGADQAPAAAPAAVDRVALAKAAIQDPEATPAEKAQAKKILLQLQAAE